MARNTKETPAPSPADHGELCVDVGFDRACWAADCPGGVCLLERTVPHGPKPQFGWRCSGMGAERSCSPRARGPSAFSCDSAQTCVQRRPRYPDDGEWECTDQFGVAVCRGGVAPSGISPGPPDPGWICGTGSDSMWGDRVCVDLSPDMPNDRFPWSCRYEVRGEERRVCVSATGAYIGGPCDAGACPQGGICAEGGVSGVCLPPKPQPSCFTDADCGSTQCLFGTCGSPTR